MSVSITGPILSALLFEHSNADSDREGLLLGTVTDVTTSKISDADISNVEHQIVYTVYSFIPCFGLSSWYDRKGAVNKEAMAKILNGYSVKEVLGWYKLRRNSSLSMSLRERAVHRHFSNWLFQMDNDRNPLFMLCVSSSTGTSSLYTCDHLFVVSTSAGYVSLPENIINLAAIAQPSYKFHSEQITSATCTYNRVLNKARAAFVEDDEDEAASVTEIKKLNSKLRHKLKSLCENVKDSEAQVAKELAEVQLLREQVATQRAREKAERQRPSSSDLTTVPNDAVEHKTLLLDNVPDARCKPVPSSVGADNKNTGLPKYHESQDTLPEKVPASENSNKPLETSPISSATFDELTILDNEDACPVPCLTPKAAAGHGSADTDSNISTDSNTADSTILLDMAAGNMTSTVPNSTALSMPAESVVSTNSNIPSTGHDEKPVKNEPFNFVADILQKSLNKSSTLPRNSSRSSARWVEDGENTVERSQNDRYINAKKPASQVVCEVASNPVDDDDDEFV